MEKVVKYSLVDRTEKAEEFCNCAMCKQLTLHLIVSDYLEDGEEQLNDGANSIWWMNNYRIIQCRGCQKVSFQVHRAFSEDCDFNNEPNIRILSYPEEFSGDTVDVYSLPQELWNIYPETIKAVAAKLLILGAAGIRAIVEVICKEQKAEGRDLDKKIDALVDMGIVTNDGARMLHSLRIMGNAAMHEVAGPTEEQVYAAFSVVNHMLTGCYVLPNLTKTLPSDSKTIRKPPSSDSKR